MKGINVIKGIIKAVIKGINIIGANSILNSWNLQSWFPIPFFWGNQTTSRLGGMYELKRARCCCGLMKHRYNFLAVGPMGAPCE